jgi:hypothetical protein
MPGAPTGAKRLAGACGSPTFHGHPLADLAERLEIMASQANSSVDVRGELRELQTLFRDLVDHDPQQRLGLMLDGAGKILIWSFGKPPDHFDGQIVCTGLTERECAVSHDMMLLCQRGGLVLRHCLPAFSQANDVALLSLLRANGEPETQWISFLCYTMGPYLSTYTTEEGGNKITRAWFDKFADVSVKAVAWLTNRYLKYVGGRTGNEGTPPGAQAEAATPKISNEAIALAVLADHPEWTDTQIAKVAGCNRTTLYKWTKYVRAREMLMSEKAARPRGSKSKDGHIEAWSNKAE